MEDSKIKRYHSRKTKQNIDKADEIWKIIEQAKYVTLAMVTPEGEPYCVAISFGYDRLQNCLYFHTGFTGKKIDALRSHPRVCAFILQDEGYIYGKCGHDYHSVVCYGIVSEISDEKEKREALKTMFYSLEDNDNDAELVLRSRKVEEMNLEHVNMLRMDIDSFSGKKS